MSTAHRVKITLKGVKPPVWCRLLVPSEYRLDQVYEALITGVEADLPPCGRRRNPPGARRPRKHLVGVGSRRVYLSYQPSRRARPRVPLNSVNISSEGVASLSISIRSATRARTAKM
jgi:hypothetical protein